MIEPTPDDQITQLVKEQARSLGFALVGITAPLASEHADYVRRWLTEGRHGTMEYLARNVEVRLDPTKLMAGAKAVICVADRHAGSDEATERLSDEGAALGRVARYAWGEDYHQVIKKRLHAMCDALRERWPEHEYRAAVDTAPIMEREHAHHAGLGWIGKHTLLLHPKLGSYLLLGQIITTLPLTPDPDSGDVPMSDHCGTCTRCIDACPTACITPYQLDASRCLSYLTIEHRDVIDEEFHEAMGAWIAGCDVCQEVCPYNARVEERGDARSATARKGRTANVNFPLLEILNWSPTDRTSAFTRSALKRIKLDMLKRNALIAAGNHIRSHDSPALRARMVALADDADESQLVRTTARQVLARLAL